MPILETDLTVRDYHQWKLGFDDDSVHRARSGVRRYQILRDTNDPTYVTVHQEFDSVEEAEAFRAALTEVWDRVGDRIGLQQAMARVMEIVEVEEY